MKSKKNKLKQEQAHTKKMSVLWFIKDWCKGNIFKGEIEF